MTCEPLTGAQYIHTTCKGKDSAPPSLLTISVTSGGRDAPSPLLVAAQWAAVYPLLERARVFRHAG